MKPSKTTNSNSLSKFLSIKNNRPITMKTFEYDGKTYEVRDETLIGSLEKHSKNEDLRGGLITLGKLHGTVKEVIGFTITDVTPEGF